MANNKIKKIHKYGSENSYVKMVIKMPEFEKPK